MGDVTGGLADEQNCDGEVVDIADINLASRIHALANARYYAEMLSGLQEAVAVVGLEFRKGSASGSAELLPAVETQLALAVAKRGIAYLWPRMNFAAVTKRAEAEVADGYAQRMLGDFLAGLRMLGVDLVAERGAAGPFNWDELPLLEVPPSDDVEGAEAPATAGPPSPLDAFWDAKWIGP
jgi:hypothetical protein